jgi:threonyl-tRNA synthetase
LNLDSVPLKEKIKNVYYNKYPYYLVFGQNEIKEDLVTFSHYDDYSLQKKIKFNLFLEKIKNEFNPLIEN